VKPRSCLSSSVKGILKREWAVLPPGIIDAATPDVAVAMVSLFRLRTVPISALYKKVFPVPPGPSTKNKPPHLESIVDIISS
jgi:hypothetical protein